MTAPILAVDDALAGWDPTSVIARLGAAEQQRELVNRLFPRDLAPARTDVRVRSETGLWSAQISAVGIELTKALARIDAGLEPVVPILDEIVTHATLGSSRPEPALAHFPCRSSRTS